MGKRVALFIDSLAGGGAERIVISLAYKMQSLGHQPEIFVLVNRTEHSVPNHFPVHFLYTTKKVKIKGRLRRKKHANNLSALVRQIEGKNGIFDLFLVNLDESQKLVSACDFTPCYYVIHNALDETLKRLQFLHPIKYFYLKYILRCMNGKNLICVSKGIQNEIENSTLIKPKSLQTIYNPFDIEKIRELSCKLNSEPPKTDYILHIGRFVRVKRHDVLFEALRLLPEHVKLVCLSNKSDKLLKKVKEIGLEHRVKAVDFTDNPYPWIKAAKALVLSSDSEGLPNVLIESIICNTPPVSTDCKHGPNEILTGKLSQFLVPRRDPTQLAQKIESTLSQSIDLTDADILQHVDALNVVEQYLALATTETN